MTSEHVVRLEAKKFIEHNYSLQKNHEAINLFHSIKERLSDFYTEEYKSIFLDEIKLFIVNKLQEHWNIKHNGKPQSNCPFEIKIEKVLFYLNQELETLPIIAHQKKHINNVSRNKIFVSYSRIDQNFLIDMKRHFKPFFESIDFWDDSKILPGQKWKEEIAAAINETKVAILLLSADYLASEFIASNELPPLLRAAEENGAVILIVILKPCLFEEFKELNQYQAMHSPSRPVIKMDITEKEELYVNLVRQTKRILESS